MALRKFRLKVLLQRMHALCAWSSLEHSGLSQRRFGGVSGLC